MIYPNFRDVKRWVGWGEDGGEVYLRPSAAQYSHGKRQATVIDHHWGSLNRVWLTDKIPSSSDLKNRKRWSYYYSPRKNTPGSSYSLRTQRQENTWCVWDARIIPHSFGKQLSPTELHHIVLNHWGISPSTWPSPVVIAFLLLLCAHALSFHCCCLLGGHLSALHHHHPSQWPTPSWKSHPLSQIEYHSLEILGGLTRYFSLVATDILVPREVVLLFQFCQSHHLRNLEQFPQGLVWRYHWITPQSFSSFPQRTSWCLKTRHKTFGDLLTQSEKLCFPSACLPFQVRQNLFFLCCLGLRILMLPLIFFIFFPQENSIEFIIRSVRHRVDFQI